MPGNEGAVQDNGRSCQRPGSERKHIGPTRRIGQASRIAIEHFDIGQQMVRGGHRLGALQMSVTRHDRVAGPRGQPDERFLEAPHRGNERRRLVAHPKAQIGCHLIVARTRRVQFGPGRPDFFGQSRLDVHVHILELFAPDEPAGADFLGDGIKTPLDGRHLPQAEQAGFTQCCGMRF